ncbi:MAG: AMP-dependent synthetase [Betaproteobacteria bacterium]|nr:AMP-dependent synthetase [Betaproteobacteria bacterium]
MKFATLNDALIERRSSARSIHYIEGEDNERAVRFADLHSRALGLLHHFQACGAKPGDELILLVDNNAQFIDAFWACVLGNLIAVPLAAGTTDEHKLKFFRVLDKLKAPHLCTDGKIHARLATFAARTAAESALERLKPKTIFIDRIEDISHPGHPHAAMPDDIAFVQYSSGSTSEPKGVALTHRNLLTNIAAIAQGIKLSGEDIGLSWMPLTHDMGLIGFHLTPLVMDVTHHLMPTAVFVRRPQLWLLKASEKKATVLCSPNFGYRHFLKTFKAEKAALDLKSVRILFNGAEPISVAICEEFLTTLVPFGLARSSMFPVYGLAEASLAATFPMHGNGYSTISVRRDTLAVGSKTEPLSASDPHANTLVLVGQPVAGCELRIADEKRLEMPSGTVGHVLIRGDNVTRGYYRDSASTAAAISDGGWLDTGDLGFCSSDGLAITGRAKEILFVSGQNYYPQDLEAVVEKHAGIELGKAALCGVRPDNAATDDVLAFILYRGELTEFLPTVKAVRKAVNEHIGIVVSHVIPISKMPKTTSGKIQRYLLADAYQKGEFSNVVAQLHDLTVHAAAAAPEAHNEIERNLKEICNSFLTDRPVGVHDNIFELGTSSLTLAQIYQRIEVIYPGQLEVTDFFDYPTIAELAKYLQSRLNAAQT